MLSQPSLTDAEYDALLQRTSRRSKPSHPELKAPDSPTLRVGARRRQTSLNRSNIQSRCSASATSPAKKPSTPGTNGPSITLEIDSADHNARAQDRRSRSRGHLRRWRLVTQAATRGDGTQGENITDNIRTIRLSSARSSTATTFPGRNRTARRSLLPHLGLRPPKRRARSRRPTRLRQSTKLRVRFPSPTRLDRNRQTSARHVLLLHRLRSRTVKSPTRNLRPLQSLNRWGCKTNAWSRRRRKLLEEAMATIQNVPEIQARTRLWHRRRSRQRSTTSLSKTASEPWAEIPDGPPRISFQPNKP